MKVFDLELWTLSTSFSGMTNRTRFGLADVGWCLSDVGCGLSDVGCPAKAVSLSAVAGSLVSLALIVGAVITVSCRL